MMIIIVVTITMAMVIIMVMAVISMIVGATIITIVIRMPVLVAPFIIGTSRQHYKYQERSSYKYVFNIHKITPFASVSPLR
jgi:hypothetical protein